MTPEQFCYWLQGRAELCPDIAPTEAEWQMIREHLKTVFVKITPEPEARPQKSIGWTLFDAARGHRHPISYC